MGMKMLSEVKKSLAQALKKDLLAGYKVEGKKFRGGKNGLLHIQDAVEVSSGKSVSIISVELKELEGRCSSKAEVRCAVDAIKKGAALLTQLRHPGIFQVILPLVEDEKRLRLVGERILSLLPHEISSGTLSKQEKLLGLLRCCKAMQFIHDRAGYLLCDFSPQALCVVEGGEWAIFDLSHALLGNELSDFTFSYPLCSIAAPLLDYCSTEVLQALKPLKVDPIDLFIPSSVGELAVKLPESDVFSFVLVCVEVLSGRKSFNLGDNTELQSKQYQRVEEEVSKWFSGRPLSAPRPPLSVLQKECIFTTEDMLVLTALKEYDTLDDGARFVLLKRVYNELIRSAFDEVLVLRLVIPLMLRESLQESRLRYALPILLQCCQCVSASAFSAHLREFFVGILKKITTTESLHDYGVLSELILDKFDLLAKHFSNALDQNLICVPFLEHCVSLTFVNSRVIRLAVDRISLMAEGSADLKFSDKLPERLVDLSMKSPENTASLIVCLERVLRYASLAARESTEVRLVHYASLATLEAGLMPHVVGRFLYILEHLQKGFSKEHKATRSIPMIAPLLLSPSIEVSSFSRRCIERMVVELTLITSCSERADGRTNLEATASSAQLSSNQMLSDLSFFDSNGH